MKVVVRKLPDGLEAQEQTVEDIPVFVGLFLFILCAVHTSRHGWLGGIVLGLGHVVCDMLLEVADLPSSVADMLLGFWIPGELMRVTLTILGNELTVVLDEWANQK
jgi:hypothetical protein